jgi:hypothetical protein
MLIGVAVGVVTSILFHLGTPEPPPTSYSRSNSVDWAAVDSGANSEPVLKRKMSPRKFLNVPQFYQVALLYMCTRLFANLSQVQNSYSHGNVFFLKYCFSQVYVPLYLHDSLKESAEALATVPLAMFLSSFAMSFLVGHLNKFCGRKVSPARIFSLLKKSLTEKFKN